jgi:phosphoribosyl 1,2-cyclic phosphate phosphodiesterase
MQIPGGTIESVMLPHGRLEVIGLVFTETATGRKLAYYTDCKRLPPRAQKLAEGADVAVLDALRPMPHPTHMSISEAIVAAQALNAKRTYFTHMTFMIDHERDSKDLPETIAYAYDGLRLEI